MTAHSLRGRLLGWVLLPLAGAVLVDGVVGFRGASQTAGVVQDRLLLGAARIVAEQVRFEDGAVQAQMPPAALELFQSADVDRVFYRVITSSGRTVAGYAELRLPTSDILELEIPRFFDSVVRDRPVRAVAYLQPVLTETGIEPVRVEIAQTLQGRDQLTRALWTQAMVQHVVTLALVTLFVLVGLRYSLRPLLRLRDAVLERRPGSLQALEIDAMPVELAPLVGAINEYARRLEHHVSVQQAFIQNAAHQLRTPLTLLTTQASFAVRATDETERTESLAAIRTTVAQSVRLVNQLLALSAAEAHRHAEQVVERTALDAVVRRAVEGLAGRALAKGIDLGVEMNDGEAVVRGHAVTLHEIVSNLLDNAIRYTQPGGVVTSRITATPSAVVLSVEDDGPGIPASQRERAFERFHRLRDDDSDGCGLGLAIVREFAASLGAGVTLGEPPTGRGLLVEVTFPR